MTKTLLKPLPTLPYGCGSVQLRGRVFWLVYKDVAGSTIQENSRTQDHGEALRLLAVRALVTAQARVAALQEIADGKTVGERKRPRASRRDSRRGTGAGIAAGRRRPGSISAGSRRAATAKKGGHK